MKSVLTKNGLGLSVVAFAIGLVWASVAFAQTQQKPAAVPPDHAAKMAQGLALFKERVRPVLISQCLECHGGKAKKGNFDLSDRKPLIESGVIEGGGKACRLYKLITHAEEPHMPSKKPKLADADIENIARWIDLGAPYDKPLDRFRGNGKSRGAEDGQGNRGGPQLLGIPRARGAFTAGRLGKAPRGCARRSIGSSWRGSSRKGSRRTRRPSAATLIRRLSFDLIGLPPTPEEVDAFLADNRPDAYEQLVDRLLASPHYGERWARHWMDVARFAESHGYEQDYDRPFAFHYRDFLIKALNRDMPFDQFVRWQLAGDELAPDDPQAMAATGFLGAGAFPTQLTEAEFESARYNELDDMVATTGTAMLGLTIGCARCHDHKYDPILAEDYYRLASVFTTAIRSEVDLVMQPGVKPTKVQVTSEGFHTPSTTPTNAAFPTSIPRRMCLLAATRTRSKPRPCRAIFMFSSARGRTDKDWNVTPPTGWTRTSMRRAGAGELDDRHHERGRGSGRAGDRRTASGSITWAAESSPRPAILASRARPPSHPELLEWLAADLVQHGWTLKRLHKLIVTSAVYMQDSRIRRSSLEGRSRKCSAVAIYAAAAGGRADPR